MECMHDTLEPNDADSTSASTPPPDPSPSSSPSTDWAIYDETVGANSMRQEAAPAQDPPFVPPTSSMPPPATASEGKSSTGTRSLIAAVAMGAAAALVGVGIGHYTWGAHSPQAVAAPSSPQYAGGGSSGSNPFGFAGPGNSGSSNTSSSAAVSAVAAKVSPSLVDINTNLGYQSATAAGTGIVLTSDGTILTNNHVIAGATKITATDIGNGKTYNALVVGYDRSHDIAVLKLQGASGLKTASIGSSRNVAVGQAIIGIGNAGGVGGTPSTASGAITALNQSITASDTSSSSSEQLSGLIQTNAPIEPGDSGGPLVNMKGEVVGIDTAASEGYVFSGSGTSASEGYSIPIDAAMSIAHAITGGHGSPTVHLGTTGFMGVQVQPNNSTNGVSVVGAISGSPAASAGLSQGDVIVKVNGSAVTTPEQLTGLISQLHPGDKVALVWQDTSGTTHTGTLVLVKGPAA